MSKKIVVTGLGILSAIGAGVLRNLEALQLGETGICQMKYLESRHKALPVGEIKFTNQELLDMLSLDIEVILPRNFFISLIAIAEALESAKIKPREALYRIGLIIGTSVGGMDKTEKYYDRQVNGLSQGKLRNMHLHDCGSITEAVADYFGIKDFVSTVTTACSSGANAILMGGRLIRSGLLDVVIVGGVDALTLFTLNGFDSLQILDRELCKPFDHHRRGLNLGEAAGFLVIESENNALRRSGNILCEFSAAGNAADAYHQTASSPEGTGARLAMSKTIQQAGILPKDIQLVNAHGTGTRNNDLSEGIAIEQIFGDNVPYVSSTKGYTGHTLGAAGGVEAIFSVLSILDDCVFANLNFSTPMQELAFRPVDRFLESAGIRHVLSNSFGFGGNSTSLLFSKYQAL